MNKPSSMTYGQMRRRALSEDNGVHIIKGQKTKLSEAFDSYIKDDKNRMVTGLAGGFKFYVPLLTSEECLDICKSILDGADEQWALIKKWRKVTVADVVASLEEKDDDLIAAVFGGFDDEKEIAQELAEIQKDNSDVESRDVLVDTQKHAILIDTALRDVKADPENTPEMIRFLQENSTVLEIADWIGKVSSQIGLDKYLKSRPADAENDDEKKK